MNEVLEDDVDVDPEVSKAEMMKALREESEVVEEVTPEPVSEPESDHDEEPVSLFSRTMPKEEKKEVEPEPEVVINKIKAPKLKEGESQPSDRKVILLAQKRIRVRIEEPGVISRKIYR